MQRELSKRRCEMTTRSRNRDERKKDLEDVLLVYDGHVASNSNKVNVYLVSLIIALGCDLGFEHKVLPSVGRARTYIQLRRYVRH